LEDHLTLERITTGVPGLDEILRGGLMKAGVYLVRGEPGSGKTIFAHQICFHTAKHGGKVAYVTLLAESHGRMLENLQGLSFFRSEAIPADIYYVSAFNALKENGLPGVLSLLAAEIRSRKVDLLVLDGLLTASQAAGSPDEVKQLVSELQVYTGMMGCTVLLLNSVSASEPVTPEQTMVDGIFRLRNQLSGSRHERTLEVVKFRGSAALDGTHDLRIDDDGVEAFPRLEAARIAAMERRVEGRALSTGVLGFDALSKAAGYPRGSVSAVAGAPGTGKTLLGLHFVGQASPEEPALLFGFNECPGALLDIGASFGIDLDGRRKEGLFEIVWQPYGGLRLDELAYRLLDAVERTGCKRLFIDGFAGFVTASAFKERGTAFLGALSNELRRLGTTTLVTVETDDPQGFARPIESQGLSAMADNLIRLRIEEEDGRMRRFVSMGKVRGSRIDVSLHELCLSDSGLQVESNKARSDAGQG
jgi:circadian clock protein KaiC